MAKYLWKDFKKNWEKKALKINKNVGLQYHVLSIFLGFFVGIIIYFLTITYLIPKNLPIQNTTAINWLVLNKHSLILDYIKAFLFISLTVVSSLICWYFMIWKRES